MINMLRNDVNLIKKTIESSKLSEIDKMSNILKNHEFAIDIIREKQAISPSHKDLE